MNDAQRQIVREMSIKRLNDQIKYCEEIFKRQPNLQIGYVNEYYEFLKLERASRIGK